MKEASWNDCIDTLKAIHRTPDLAKSKSLIETAEERLAFLEQPLTQKNVNFIFEGMYSSLLEMLHAYLVREGIEIENHVCIGFYLRDILKREDLFNMFDDCRYKRNGIVYYGKRMPFEVGKESISKLQRLLLEARKL